MEGPPGLDGDLIEACLQAPKHGLNAKALILQAALAADDEEGDEREAKRQRRDPAAESDAAALRRGPEFLEAVDVKQRPLVAYIARSKIPRIHRQTVLGKLVGQHLALAASRRQPPLEPAEASADLTLRQATFGAALSQELDLYGKCGSGQVYQNLAARTSALQWQQAQPQAAQGQQRQQPQEGKQQQQQRRQQQQQQQTDKGGTAGSSSIGMKRAAAEVAGAAGRPAADGASTGAPSLPGGNEQKKQRKAAAAAPALLEEADLDWDAAVPESLAVPPVGVEATEALAAGVEAAAAAEGETNGRGTAGGDAGSALGRAAAGGSSSQQHSVPGTARPSGVPTTEVGQPSFQPLARLPLAVAAPGADGDHTGTAGTAGTASSDADADAGDGDVGRRDERQQQTAAPHCRGPLQPSKQAVPSTATAGTNQPAAEAAAAAAAPPPLPPPAAGAATGAAADVEAQVRVFVLSELHPLLRRQHITRQLHDTVCDKCVRKVMQRHVGATSADFLAQEGTSIRALVHQYVAHMQKQHRQ